MPMAATKARDYNPYAAAHLAVQVSVIEVDVRETAMLQSSL